jgi:hypothetical protein
VFRVCGANLELLSTTTRRGMRVIYTFSHFVVRSVDTLLGEPVFDVARLEVLESNDECLALQER